MSTTDPPADTLNGLKRATGRTLARACVIGDRTPGVAAVAVLARSLRLQAGLSTRELAARSGLARSTITRLEAAQLRPRRSMLAVLAVGLDPGRRRELLSRLVDAAGGDMAVDTPGWRRYRRRRVGRAVRNGALPVPAGLIRWAEEIGAQAGPRVALACLQQELTKGMNDDGPTTAAADPGIG